MKQRFPDDRSASEAKFAAQKLAFGPLMFQAARVLRDRGVLEFLRGRAMAGATEEEVSAEAKLSIYAARVLLEAGLAAEMLEYRERRYILTKIGYMILRDPMTRVNMNFVHDICYQPMFHFDKAISEGKASGLAMHGEWPNIYEGLSRLPEAARESWFAFDHFYSDGVFERAIPQVFADQPKRILDIGGNTGKFAMRCCQHDPDVQVTIVDLPGQLAVALENAQQAGLGARIAGQAADLLDDDAALPSGFDILWMSQFLDCFGEDSITSILRRAAAVMNENSRLFILETYWDRQDYEAARYCVINTSLYFTGVANGTSKMLHSERMLACLADAGLEVEADEGEMGFHTLWRCKVA